MTQYIKQIRKSEEGGMAVMLVLVILSVIIVTGISVTSLRLTRLQIVQDTEATVKARAAAEAMKQLILKDIQILNSEEKISDFYKETAPSGSQTNCDLNVWQDIPDLQYDAATQSFEYCIRDLGLVENDVSSVPKYRHEYEIRARKRGTPPSDVVGRAVLSLEAVYQSCLKMIPDSADIEAEDTFGVDVDVEQNRVVAGSPTDTLSRSGKVYVYDYDPLTDSWNYQILTSSEDESGERFGASVDIEGDWLVASASANDLSSFVDAGAVYIFKRQTDNTWVETQMLQPDEDNGDPITLQTGDRFGADLAMFGDIIVIGSPYRDRGGNNAAGSTYIYKYNTGIDTWELIQDISGPTSDADEPQSHFGSSVTIFGRYLAVAAEDRTVGSYSRAGKVYIYKQTGGVWAEIQGITSPNSGSVYEFGNSLDLHQRLLVVGEHFNDNPDGGSSENLAGAAYVYYQKNDEMFYVEKSLSAISPQPSEEFGGSVSVKAGTIAVGARGVNEFVNVHDRDQVNEQETWRERVRLINTDNPGGMYGSSVELSYHRLVIGDPLDDTEGSGAGAIYVCDR